MQPLPYGTPMQQQMLASPMQSQMPIGAVQPMQQIRRKNQQPRI
jgi:hypothetical protein